MLVRPVWDMIPLDSTQQMIVWRNALYHCMDIRLIRSASIPVLTLTIPTLLIIAVMPVRHPVLTVPIPNYVLLAIQDGFYTQVLVYKVALPSQLSLMQILIEYAVQLSSALKVTTPITPPKHALAVAQQAPMSI